MSEVVKTVPPDMTCASRSGLDPHISPEAARLQVARVAGSLGVLRQSMQAMDGRFNQTPQWSVPGQARANSLLLNMSLDENTSGKNPGTVALNNASRL